MTDFLMPSLGADMEFAVLVEWLVKPGDRLKPGDLIAVVETDKGAIDLEVFEECVVDSLIVEAGTEVKVDALLARLRSPGTEGTGITSAPAVAAVAPAVPASAPPAPAARESVPLPLASPETGMRTPVPRTLPEGTATVRASPAARTKAAALGVDLWAVQGSGPDGAVLLADLATLPARTVPRAKGGFDPAAMRRAIAAAVSRAKREIPHYYLTHAVGLGPAMNWLARENSHRGVAERLLPAVLLLKATALALQTHRDFVGHYRDGSFQPAPGIHIGWAISLRGGGLIAPALHEVDLMDLTRLMQALRDLVQRARNGGLRGSELRDAAITITSLGERSAETVLPIIHPPQVAMLGFGSIVERPWLTEDGGLAAQPVVTVTLAADHRVSDGHQGGRLLADIAQRLAAPESL